ncbi:hypothetical protein [Nocardia sp. NPDC049149]|uniref:hypothetical protein n=1 Tax=Nocardia sp. NPDC049149 TaxID=3364315 RepID=UPI0037151FDF
MRSTFSTTPWLEPGHFQPRDQAVRITLTARGCTESPIEVLDPTARSVRTEGGETMVSDGFGAVRHRSDCPPCAADIYRIRIEGGRIDGRYAGRWSDEAIARCQHLACRIGWARGDHGWRGTFLDGTEVPDWLRDTTAQLLRAPAGFGLEVAQILDPLDWPTLLEHHPDDLDLVLDAERDEGPFLLDWEPTVDAFHVLAAAGHSPFFAASIGIGVTTQLQLRITALLCHIYPIDTVITNRVSTVLGGIDYDDRLPGWSWKGLD